MAMFKRADRKSGNKKVAAVRYKCYTCNTTSMAASDRDAPVCTKCGGEMSPS